MSEKKHDFHLDKGQNQPKENENLKRIKNKIMVISGKGGVGKSTVSVNLAMGLSLKGFRVGVMDIDIHGPSIAKMLNIEGQKLGINRASNMHMPVEVFTNFYALTIASMLEDPEQPIVWRGPLKMGAIKQFLEDIEWPELDYLIIDSPPGTGDEPLSAAQLIGKVTGTVIVSTPQEVALIDSRKAVRFAQMLKMPVLGIVENMSGFVCPHCGEKTDLFKEGGAEKAAEEMNVNFLGKIPIEPEIVHSGDSGKPYIYDFNKKQTAQDMMTIVEKILDQIEEK